MANFMNILSDLRVALYLDQVVSLKKIISTFRLSHHEFLKRYSLVLKHLDPGAQRNMPPPQTHSSKKPEASLRCTTVERLKRRSRRRHRSSYDHTRHICRSILEVVQLESDESKENIQARECNNSVKVGRTKIFLQEEAVGETVKYNQIVVFWKEFCGKCSNSSLKIQCTTVLTFRVAVQWNPAVRPPR